MLSCAFAATSNSPVSCMANSTPVRAKSRASTLLETGCVGAALGSAAFVTAGPGDPGAPMACLFAFCSGTRAGCGGWRFDNEREGSRMCLKLMEWSARSSDRDARPLNVMSAFCAAQLRDSSEKSESTRVEFSGMLVSDTMLSRRREIAVPIVALLAVPGIVVVVHPVASLFVHVLPVKPLMQTQLHERSGFSIDMPPF